MLAPLVVCFWDYKSYDLGSCLSLTTLDWPTVVEGRLYTL